MKKVTKVLLISGCIAGLVALLYKTTKYILPEEEDTEDDDFDENDLDILDDDLDDNDFETEDNDCTISLNERVKKYATEDNNYITSLNERIEKMEKYMYDM